MAEPGAINVPWWLRYPSDGAHGNVGSRGLTLPRATAAAGRAARPFPSRLDQGPLPATVTDGEPAAEDAGFSIDPTAAAIGARLGGGILKTVSPVANVASGLYDIGSSVKDSLDMGQPAFTGELPEDAFRDAPAMRMLAESRTPAGTMFDKFFNMLPNPISAAINAQTNFAAENEALARAGKPPLSGFGKMAAMMGSTPAADAMIKRWRMAEGLRSREAPRPFPIPPQAAPRPFPVIPQDEGGGGGAPQNAGIENARGAGNWDAFEEAFSRGLI